MSSSIAPTTTYPFTLTTGGGTPWYSVNVTTPTVLPTVVPFASERKCCGRWSQYPLDSPFGLNASCVITNDGCSNPDAFWDLYACCNGAKPQVFGEQKCTATCEAVGQSWQELMSCLQKRAPVVVCKPNSEEIAKNVSETAITDDFSTALVTTGGVATSTGSFKPGEMTGVSAESSTGAANIVDVVHIQGSKVGFMVFALLAFGSAAGMFL
ncbi:hypothetical protein K505DRAFT_322171 [Melanomma pulvis-pyrius CBS 109.77]|uniref:Uncharacterized protein n=1 Tax=Melanomma pulvis-pyrius CBS 109.77 TaxID=1314802 RepID=A0A6A6XN90_9PLEO|nr:hypothetical protein K505DRAFT_322171 [Melanomma pulvis-pyrius CBS 109.77]